jgi:hypothetical protein
MMMPWLAGVIGVRIGIIAITTTRRNNKRRFIAKVLYTIAGFWLIYVVWEIYSDSTGANIRVDFFSHLPISVFL